MGMNAQPGLRERKKQQTRQLIADTARRLLARERQVFARYAESLAALIAEETGSAPDDAEPRAAANALLGVHRALIDYVRQRTLAGARASEIGPDLRSQ